MVLALLILGLAGFIGPHVFVMQRKPRSAAVAQVGENLYKAIFSLVVIIGIALIAYGFGLYRTNGYIRIWSPPLWLGHVALLLNWPAIVFVTARFIPGEIQRRLKHPMLAGVKVWAFAHLLANGDLGSIILFGGLLAWAVYARIALKAIGNEGMVSATAGGRNDIIVVVVGTIVYLALVFIFHPIAIGVPAFMR